MSLSTFNFSSFFINFKKYFFMLKMYAYVYPMNKELFKNWYYAMVFYFSTVLSLYFSEEKWIFGFSQSCACVLTRSWGLRLFCLSIDQCLLQIMGTRNSSAATKTATSTISVCLGILHTYLEEQDHRYIYLCNKKLIKS